MSNESLAIWGGTTVVLRDGVPTNYFPGIDGRLFEHNGTLYALATIRAGIDGTSACRRRVCIAMGLVTVPRQLVDPVPGVRARRLKLLQPTELRLLARLPAYGAKNEEKNWVYIPHSMGMYFSRTICPHHVLKCELRTGGCALAHSTSLPRCSSRLHGGPPLVRIPARNSSSHALDANADHTNHMLVGVAHIHSHGKELMDAVKRGGHLVDRLYHHMLYRVDPSPPFALLKIGPRVRLPPLFRDNDLDRVQFCTGANYLSQLKMLRIEYGVGDCGAASTDIPLRTVQDMLSL
jgi:hypothetical protein